MPASFLATSIVYLKILFFSKHLTREILRIFDLKFGVICESKICLVGVFWEIFLQFSKCMSSKVLRLNSLKLHWIEVLLSTTNWCSDSFCALLYLKKIHLRTWSQIVISHHAKIGKIGKICHVQRWNCLRYKRAQKLSFHQYVVLYSTSIQWNFS